MKPEEGLRLGGRYELRSRLAVGGMGEVWLTRDLSLKRSVATKVLRPELAGDERFLEFLRAEARTSAPLTHPNIAALYDYGEDDDGAGYLVMELVTGEPLSEVLEREGALHPEVVLPVLAQAARALHAAHVSGVVHRDVKPSNILLTRDGGVKITDFGISVGPGAPTSTPRGTVMGTVHYISPEQALGRPATPASDVYSLGVVAYEMATGGRPFTGPDLADVAHAHVHERVPDLPGDLPAGLRDLVGRMLAKHPEQRPRSAASVARAAERALAELELARPVDAQDEAPRWPVQAVGLAAPRPDRSPGRRDGDVDPADPPTQPFTAAERRELGLREAPASRPRGRHALLATVAAALGPTTALAGLAVLGTLITAALSLGAYRLNRPVRNTQDAAVGPRTQTEGEDGSW